MKTNSNYYASYCSKQKQSLMEDVKITTSLLIDCTVKKELIAIILGNPYNN